MPPAQTLAERILVHLRTFPIERDALDVPPDVTQEGIAMGVGAQVAHVSRGLRSLEVRGLVSAHLAHPRGARRRSRAYTLTEDGLEHASGLTMPAPVAAVASTRKETRSGSIPAGRAAQASTLALALDEAIRGAPRVVLVEGDAGSGKSRILSYISHDATQKGARVLSASAAPTGAQQLLGPIVDALAPVGFDRRFRARAAGTPHERALAAALESLDAAARAQPVAVLIDDLHHAGASVAEFVHGLARALSPDARVLLVLSFRREEGWRLPNGPLYTALTPLRHLEGARHVELPPLDEKGVALLLEDAGADHVPAELIARVTRESGGNPHYVLAMADAMADGVDESDFFPTSVQALATSRFAGIPAEAHALLQAAAVCGPEFRYEQLLRVHGEDESGLLASLDILLDRLLLEEVPVDGDRLELRFAHPKIREAVLAETSAPLRRALEARAAPSAEGHQG